MSQARDKFIAEVVKDLDAEGQQHAAAELYVEMDVETEEEEFSAATERLKQSPMRSYSRVRIGLMVMLFLSFAMTLGVRNTSGLIAYQDWEFRKILDRKLPDYSALYEGQFTAEEEMLLIKDSLGRTFEKMGRTLEWVEAYNPQSSCYLLEYLSFGKNDTFATEKLSDEVFNEKLKLAFERPYYKVKDEVEQQRIRIILNKAKGADYALRTRCVFFLQIERDYQYVNSDILVDNLVRVEANECPEEIKWWLTRYIHYLNQRVKWIASRWDSEGLQRDINALLPMMTRCFQRIQWDEMTSKLELLQVELRNKLEQLKELRKKNVNSKHSSKNKKAMMSFGGVGVDHSLGRYAEHAVAGRVFASMAWCLFFVILLFAWLYRFIRKTKLTPLGLKFCGALEKKEWCWILLGPVLFPIAFYWCLTRYTDMSAREWLVGEVDEFGNLRSYEYGAVQDVAAIDQFIAMILAILCLSICMVRWRLKVAFPMLVKSSSWLAWGMAILAFFAMIVAGFIDEQTIPAIIVFTEGMLGIVGVYLIVVSMRFVVRRASIEKYVVNRALTPVLATAVLMMVILAACFYEEEKYYVAKDPQTSFDAELGMTVYEATRVKAEKKKLQAMLSLLEVNSNSDGEE